jgi:Flp pilus assembly protein TadD
MENIERLHTLIKEMGAMDLFGQIYEELRTSRVDAYDSARSQGCEDAYLRSLIEGHKKTYSAHRVFPTVLHDPIGEGLSRAQDVAYFRGDPSALLMLPRVQRAARKSASGTMVAYLTWLQRSHLGESDLSIARTTRRSEATIRGGRKRALEFLITVAYDLRHGGTTVDSELPDVLKMAADCYAGHRLEDAARILDECSDTYMEDPRWLNIRGLVEIGTDDCEAAVIRFKKGLMLADEIEMRAKLLNNWGKALHNLGRLEEAQAIYLRASRLAPEGTPPLLNLLAVASERRDLQDCRHYANQLVKLLSSGRLSDKQKGTVMNRLSDNPMYDWVRLTQAWKGPGRWLRKWSAKMAALALFAFCPLAVTATAASTPTLEVCDVQTEGDKGEGWITPTKVSVTSPEFS